MGRTDNIAWLTLVLFYVSVEVVMPFVSVSRAPQGEPSAVQEQKNSR